MDPPSRLAVFYRRAAELKMLCKMASSPFVQPVGDVGGVVLTRLKRQIKIGTEERGAELGHEFFDGVAFGLTHVCGDMTDWLALACGSRSISKTFLSIRIVAYQAV